MPPPSQIQARRLLELVSTNGRNVREIDSYDRDIWARAYPPLRGVVYSDRNSATASLSRGSLGAVRIQQSSKKKPPLSPTSKITDTKQLQSTVCVQPTTATAPVPPAPTPLDDLSTSPLADAQKGTLQQFNDRQVSPTPMARVESTRSQMSKISSIPSFGKIREPLSSDSIRLEQHDNKQDEKATNNSFNRRPRTRASAAEYEEFGTEALITHVYDELDEDYYADTDSASKIFQSIGPSVSMARDINKVDSQKGSDDTNDSVQPNRVNENIQQHYHHEDVDQNTDDPNYVNNHDDEELHTTQQHQIESPNVYQHENQINNNKQPIVQQPFNIDLATEIVSSNSTYIPQYDQDNYEAKNLRSSHMNTSIPSEYDSTSNYLDEVPQPPSPPQEEEPLEYSSTQLKIVNETAHYGDDASPMTDAMIDNDYIHPPQQEYDSSAALSVPASRDTNPYPELTTDYSELGDEATTNTTEANDEDDLRPKVRRSTKRISTRDSFSSSAPSADLVGSESDFLSRSEYTGYSRDDAEESFDSDAATKGRNTATEDLDDEVDDRQIRERNAYAHVGNTIEMKPHPRRRGLKY